MFILPIITGGSSGIMVQNSQNTMLGCQNAATQSFLLGLWYKWRGQQQSSQVIKQQEILNCHIFYWHHEIYKCIGNKKRPVVKAIATMIGGKLKIRILECIYITAKNSRFS